MYKNLNINVGQIYEGWKNKLLPDADMVEQIELVSIERTAICDVCPNHSKNHKTVRPDEHCVSCGCTLSAKTKCLSLEALWAENIDTEVNKSVVSIEFKTVFLFTNVS